MFMLIRNEDMFLFAMFQFLLMVRKRLSVIMIFVEAKKFMIVLVKIFLERMTKSIH